MERFDSFIERQRRMRRRQLLLDRPVPPEVVASEWEDVTLRAPGSRLWAEIELYLEFVAIARAKPPHEEVRRRVTEDSTRPYTTHLRFL